MSERSLEDRCRQYARQFGAQLLKWNSASYGGVPDRILLQSPGVATFIEFKSDTQKGRVSKLQQHRIMQLRQLGFRVEVVNSFEQFTSIFHEK